MVVVAVETETSVRSESRKHSQQRDPPANRPLRVSRKRKGGGGMKQRTIETTSFLSLEAATAAMLTMFSRSAPVTTERRREETGWGVRSPA